MQKGIVVLVTAAALSGCSGGPSGSGGAGGSGGSDGVEPAEDTRTRARLHLSGPEGGSSCPAVTPRWLERQGVAFSGTVHLERPNPENPDRVNWAVEVDHWYSQGDAEVMVVQPTSDVALQYFSEAVAAGHTLIEDGDRLLVAGRSMAPRGPAGDGTKLVGYADSCLTRRWSEELAGQYERAFAG